MENLFSDFQIKELISQIWDSQILNGKTPDMENSITSI